MIESYGINGEYHVWLGLDPGITTGWALVGDDCKLLASGTFDENTVYEGLDKLIRGLHRSDRTLTTVVERMPRTGGMGELAQRLERVRGLISEVTDEVYDLPTFGTVAPGEWKTSRVAKTTKVPDTARTQHERDAYLMTCYAIDKEQRNGH